MVEESEIKFRKVVFDENMDRGLFKACVETAKKKGILKGFGSLDDKWIILKLDRFISDGEIVNLLIE